MTAKSIVGSDKCCRWIFMRAMDTTYISVLFYLCLCIHENRIYSPRWTGRWQMVVGEEKYFHLLWLYLVKLIFNVILDNLNSNSSFTHAGDLCWKPLWLLERGNRRLVRFLAGTEELLVWLLLFLVRKKKELWFKQKPETQIMQGFVSPMETWLSLTWINWLACLDSHCHLWSYTHPFLQKAIWSRIPA